MIDAEGYRENVGIILCNEFGQLFWAKRIGQDAWQFPQGGISPNETPKEALYRELKEETGLQIEDVEVMASTHGWLRYHLPHYLIRRHHNPICIGQKQVWFLLRLRGDEKGIRFDLYEQPEFDAWRWVNFWEPLQEVIAFKRKVYESALLEFAPLLGIKAQVPKVVKASLQSR